MPVTIRCHDAKFSVHRSGTPGLAASRGLGNGSANTDVKLYQTNLMAGYMTGQLGVYRCPADNIPSDNGQRIRTYSMQGQVGTTFAYQANAKILQKGFTCIRRPGPSDLIVFLEENGIALSGSVGDGWVFAGQ